MHSTVFRGRWEARDTALTFSTNVSKYVLSKLVFPATQAASVMYSAVTATSWDQFETVRKPLHVQTSSAGFSALDMCWPSARAPGTSAFTFTSGQHAWHASV